MKITDLLEIKLKVDPQIIDETLSRLGIPDIKNKVLYQSCHLVQYEDRYFLAHFKQLFILSVDKNGKPGFINISDEDVERRNSIAFCLYKWNMIDIVKPNEIEKHAIRIFVLPFKEKPFWHLVKKFNVHNLISSKENTDYV